MRDITKTRLILVSVLTLLVLTGCNANQYQSFHDETSNSLEIDTKIKIYEENELKTSADNKYKKVWDSGSTDLTTWALNIGDDIDRNGKPEIIAGRDLLGQYYEVLALEYNETFENYTIVWNSGDISDDDIKSVFAGDQDGDGKKEIIAGDEDGFLHIFEYNGTDYENVYKEYQGNDILGGFMGDDCDNDGYNEIIISCSDKVRILEYNKTDDGCEMTWQTSMTYTDKVISGDDLDGDGKKEIIVNESPNMIMVFENIANNTFKQVWNSSNKIGGSVDAICIGDDLDDDGKKEIIAGAFDEKIYVFEYNGTDNGYNKTWDSKSIIGDNIRSLCVTDDLDGDGKKEIIVGSSSPDNKLYIFEFNGTDNGFDKVWDSGANITTSTVMNVYMSDDLDRNGKKEIVAGTFGSQIYIFEHETPTPSTPSRPIIIIDEDDDDDDDDDEDGIFIPNQTLIIGGAISAVALVAVIIILIKIKSGSGR